MNKLSREEVMLQWDKIRTLIANGERSSYPRDWFESILDHFEEVEQEKYQEIREAFITVLASLAASISLLEAGGVKAAPSNKMFNQMIQDYKKALQEGRDTLSKYE